MDKYSCIVVDDESRARILLKTMLEQYCPELTVLDECEDLPSGVKAIKKHSPSLVFLDIEMPGYSGLELLEFFDEKDITFDIIFTTAYNEYAVQAFKLSAIDYLLKPLHPDQLVDAVERFKRKNVKENSLKLEALKRNLNSNDVLSEKRMMVPIGQSLKFLVVNEIVMIKGEGAYSELYLKNGDKLLASKNLKHFEEMLSGIPNFYRVHKSYIINVNEVMEYSKSDGGVVIMSNGLEAGISTDKVDEFLKIMQGGQQS